MLPVTPRCFDIGCHAKAYAEDRRELLRNAAEISPQAESRLRDLRSAQ